ncbi:putative START domain-containing protein [Helianthus annuus]|uniref:START domain-containing protein n=1 Tax=Helianthus annuus TaxID=4232 RepID=A0A9K3I9L9_HELAN|nr:putative START domain-containing protein [Helianthus annuus]KAF5811464.1 putative START domain-containing protein [Helianthus annuus]KAJ0543856.1 putative homeobox-leucine zipper protein GLAB [Helianthus annuus]
MELFPSIISRAKTLQVIISGVNGTPNASMQLVTWVEHAEAENELVHGIFTDYVSSGMAFGARRWLAVLQRQCERLASLMA